VRAVALKVWPAYGDLGWVVFISTCEATIARTCRKEMWLKGTGNRSGSEGGGVASAPVVVNLGHGLSTYFFFPCAPCDL
jgi:hypothetical protein